MRQFNNTAPGQVVSMFLSILSHFYTPSARRRRDPSSRLSKSERFVAVTYSYRVTDPTVTILTIPLSWGRYPRGGVRCGIGPSFFYFVSGLLPLFSILNFPLNQRSQIIIVAPSLYSHVASCPCVSQSAPARLLAHAGVVVGKPVWPSMPPCVASQRRTTR
jgi:hypothetical protein